MGARLLQAAAGRIGIRIRQDLLEFGLLHSPARLVAYQFTRGGSIRGCLELGTSLPRRPIAGSSAAGPFSRTGRPPRPRTIDDGADRMAVASCRLRCIRMRQCSRALQLRNRHSVRPPLRSQAQPRHRIACGQRAGDITPITSPLSAKESSILRKRSTRLRRTGSRQGFANRFPTR
jgi:hypothetical protein